MYSRSFFTHTTLKKCMIDCERMECKMDRQTIRSRFSSYIAPYDITDTKVRLKAAHTYRVAELCSRIAESLALSAEETDLAWFLGMLHDIGRFEQVRRYGTFSDADSVDHAEFGADLLFRDGLIRSFTDSSSEDGLMEKAIRLHNKFGLPDDLTERERTFCQILRDADKIDILRVNCEFPREEIYHFTEEEFRTSDISDAVLADAMAMRNVYRPHRRTAADYIVGQAALIFGLVYPESRRILREQGYLEKLLDFESSNPEARRKMDMIREKVGQFLDSYN